ncbi:MAG: hypothetical protein Q4B73_10080 [Lachnospiraceae bacterium]|nr:hypothetical protein [Lachnospiraceae bacterium]
MAKYACKQCGAELFFDPSIGKLHCEYCDSVFDPSEYDDAPADAPAPETAGAASAQEASDENGAAGETPLWEADQNAQSTDDSTGDLVVYSCPNCGAEVITARETAATTCVYCNKAITMEGNLSGFFKPDFVLPFTKTQKEVEEAYFKLCKSSILTPPTFMHKDNIKKIKGMYIPFWLYSFKGHGALDITGRNLRVWRSGKYEYTETTTYEVSEGVEASFEKIPVDALKGMDNDMMDSIEPFDMTQLQRFNPAYLAGFYTQRWDDGALENENRAKSRAKASLTQEAIGRAGHFDSTSIRSESYKWTDDKTESAMMPVWMMYTEYKGKNYIFGMNGQTGKLMGKIPKSLGRLFGIGIGTFVVSQIVMMIIRIVEVLV